MTSSAQEVSPPRRKRKAVQRVGLVADVLLNWHGTSLSWGKNIYQRCQFCRDEEDPAVQLKVEEEMAARVAAKVTERVEAAMKSEAFQQTFEARLREERANLERKVTARGKG